MIQQDTYCTAKEICTELLSVHRQFGWRAEREALFSPRRIDVLAISPGGQDIIGYEIKVSKSDFHFEIANPAKRMAVSRYCTEFYFVMPCELVSKHKIPDDCGLIYCDGNGEFEVVRPHPKNREEIPPAAATRIIWDEIFREVNSRRETTADIG